MTVININPCDCMKEGVIGHVRENEVTQLVFDLSAWIAKYGLGTVALSVMRQGDLVPYPVPIAIVDGKATWTVSATDTAKYGRIKAQLTYYVGTKRKKSNIYVLRVRESLAENGQAPDPYESWLEVLQELTAETADNAVSAQGSATAASTSAAVAAQSAEAASTSARNAGTSATQAASSASAAASSASSAAASAELAQQGAEESGFAFFDVDDSTGLMTVTVTDNLATSTSFAVNENLGTLEVTVSG